MPRASMVPASIFKNRGRTMKRIERNGYLEVVLAEIETHRAQGEGLDIELFRPEKERRVRLKISFVLGALLFAGWMAYCGVVWTGVLKAIGAW
jgi:hypothetical protein